MVINYGEGGLQNGRGGGQLSFTTTNRGRGAGNVLAILNGDGGGGGGTTSSRVVLTRVLEVLTTLSRGGRGAQKVSTI